MSGPERQLRLFVAIPLPGPAVQAVSRLLAALPGRDEWTRIRWVRPEGMHLTLRFLGPTSAGRVEDLGRAVVRVAEAATPFEVVLAGAGAFPAERRPRALWLGIASGAGQLAGLAADLGPPLEDLGWAPESRPYRPHLTIARADGSAHAFDAGRTLAQAASGWETRFAADRIALFESVTTRGPARYVSLVEAPLGNLDPDGPDIGRAERRPG
jgi:RNA 2',3'-cyclic 3'-phosphodiesterase